MSGLLDFTTFLDDHGPFDIIVDGANVAFFNQTQRQNQDVDFSVEQLKHVLHVLRYLHPEAKILTILHDSRRFTCATVAEQAYL